MAESWEQGTRSCSFSWAWCAPLKGLPVGGWSVGIYSCLEMGALWCSSAILFVFTVIRCSSTKAHRRLVPVQFGTGSSVRWYALRWYAL